MTPTEALVAIRKSDMSDDALLTILREVRSEAYGDGQTDGYAYATGE